MTRLEKLQRTRNFPAFAKLLGFEPKGLSYILYVTPDSAKYRTFGVDKRTGGVRTIKAPEEKLKLAQQRLAELLSDCIEEIQKGNPKFLGASHAFQRGKRDSKNRTIFSNAKQHSRRRYVFNIDLENFFDTINFGRVRGYFINDKHFKLDEKVATVIAQIACYENGLPQGSPCSPVISNLVGNILDSRLSSLARRAKCTYTRYADDLTFSTNTAQFPPEIAVPDEQNAKWSVGEKLHREIDRSGFSINEGKTRMSIKHSRQTVTGLVVNTKPNVSQDYYRAVRAMCHHLFTEGWYYKPSKPDAVITKLNPLEGMLSHIDFINRRRGQSLVQRAKEEQQKERHLEQGDVKQQLRTTKQRQVYYRGGKTLKIYDYFLSYKYFVGLSAPLIVCEGKTDVIYLKCAINLLWKQYPMLAGEEEQKEGRKTVKRIVLRVNFLKNKGTIRKMLKIEEGTSGQEALIEGYSDRLGMFGKKPMKHPVIILCDNDDGIGGVIKKTARKLRINKDEVQQRLAKKAFLFLGENLYLTLVPKDNSAIEGLLPEELLEMKHPDDGKEFDLGNDATDAKHGKFAFAKLIRARRNPDDFKGFDALLRNIEACIKDYKKRTTGKGNDSEKS